jgi:aldehyde dehydrogenase (NAD+)
MDLTEGLERLRATFASGKTADLAWREGQLDALLALLDAGQGELVGALAEDVGKPAIEAWATDVAASQGEVGLARAKLRDWAASRPAEVPPEWMPATASVEPQPLGLVLVVSPWNYPVQLLVQPLAAAIAAGNCVVVKPSELAPATSAVLAGLIRQHLDPDAVLAVEGGIPETTELLEQRFDHIFYTGSTEVGRVVMRAAAEHLTPVTLELGGKCPTYVHRSADLAEAGKRIAWGKFLNAGQTCLAPDYVLVDREVQDELVQSLVSAVARFYGEDPASSPDYGRIVNQRHVERLRSLRDAPGAGTVAVGGGDDVAERYVAPTVLVGTDPSSAIMGQEIFGPLLPVIAVDDEDAAVRFINARERALAAYVFAEDTAVVDRYIRRTTSGGVCVNAALLHNSAPDLPFGGVGPSGMGSYHGRHGFDRLSHLKSVLVRPSSAPIDHVMPPYPVL